MDNQQYAEAVMEGARLAGNKDYALLAQNLAMVVHDERTHILWLQNLIEQMDQLVSDSPNFTVTCKSCGEPY